MSDASPTPASDASSTAVVTCPWCGEAFTPRRSDQDYCGQRCRQASFRLRRRLEGQATPSDKPRRFVYADPPYPGLAKRHYEKEPDYAGEVDHPQLIRTLEARRARGEIDGWALSTSHRALRTLLPLCPPEARVCAWVKPGSVPPATYGPHVTWEAVIVVGGRKLQPGVRDSLVAFPARRGGDLPGRKPIAFAAFLFDVLGMLPGDTLEDLYPGTGIIGRAWTNLSCRAPTTPPAPRRRAVVASLVHEHDASLLQDDDASAPRRSRPMRLLVSVSFPKLATFRSPYLGRLLVPTHTGSIDATISAGMPVAADNGCYRGLDEARFLALLNHVRSKPLLFVTVPDVVGDARATRTRWREWAPRVRSYDVPLAYVLQDGERAETLPWDELAAVFIGGTTRWKLGADARRLVKEAKRRGKHVHMGRVNTRERVRYAYRIGCDSIDGTAWARYTDKKLPGVLDLLARLHAHETGGAGTQLGDFADVSLADPRDASSTDRERLPTVEASPGVAAVADASLLERATPPSVVSLTRTPPAPAGWQPIRRPGLALPRQR